MIPNRSQSTRRDYTRAGRSSFARANRSSPTDDDRAPRVRQHNVRNKLFHSHQNTEEAHGMKRRSPPLHFGQTARQQLCSTPQFVQPRDIWQCGTSFLLSSTALSWLFATQRIKPMLRDCVCIAGSNNLSSVRTLLFCHKESRSRCRIQRFSHSNCPHPVKSVVHIGLCHQDNKRYSIVRRFR